MSATRITAGWIPTVRLWTMSWKTFPSNDWTTRKTPSAHRATCPLVGESDQHGRGPRDECAEVGDVGADEDDGAEPEGARHPQDQQTRGDADRVDQCYQCGAPHESLDALEGPAANCLHDVGAATGNECAQGIGSPVGVAQEEEDQQAREHRHAQDPGGDADPGDEAGGSRPAESAQQVPDVVSEVPDALNCSASCCTALRSEATIRSQVPTAAVTAFTSRRRRRGRRRR